MRALQCILGFAAASAIALCAPVCAKIAPELRPSPVDDVWHVIYFHGERAGWILAHHSGALLSTVDRGETWQLRARLPAGYLEAIHFLDTQLGWIAGNDGRLHRTTDGGDTWEDRSMNQRAWHFYGVFFWDANDGMLIGSDSAAKTGLILRTADGGLTWFPQPAPATSGLAALAVDADTVFLAGSHGAWRGDRKGTEWAPVIARERGTIRGLALTPAQLFAVGHEGAAWRIQRRPEMPPERVAFTANRLRAVAFADTMTGVIVGDPNRQPGSLFVTSDGGLSWQACATPTRALHAVTIHRGRFWAVGENTILTLPRTASDLPEGAAHPKR